MHSGFSILKDVKVAVEVIREIRIKVNLFGKKGNSSLSPKYHFWGISVGAIWAAETLNMYLF